MDFEKVAKKDVIERIVYVFLQSLKAYPRFIAGMQTFVVALVVLISLDKMRPFIILEIFSVGEIGALHWSFLLISLLAAVATIIMPSVAYNSADSALKGERKPSWEIELPKIVKLLCLIFALAVISLAVAAILAFGGYAGLGMNFEDTVLALAWPVSMLLGALFVFAYPEMLIADKGVIESMRISLEMVPKEIPGVVVFAGSAILLQKGAILLAAYLPINADFLV